MCCLISFNDILDAEYFSCLKAIFIISNYIVTDSSHKSYKNKLSNVVVECCKSYKFMVFVMCAFIQSV